MRDITIKTQKAVITIGELTVKELTELLSSLEEGNGIRRRFKEDAAGNREFLGTEVSSTGVERDIVETLYKGARVKENSVPPKKTKKAKEPKETKVVGKAYKPPYPHKNIKHPKKYSRRGIGGVVENIQWTPKETERMLKLRDQGLTQQAIAEKLHRTKGMVQGHIQALRRKGWKI